MHHCTIHPDTKLTCRRCDAVERGKKGGQAKTDKKKAASVANLKKAYEPPPKEGVQQ